MSDDERERLGRLWFDAMDRLNATPPLTWEQCPESYRAECCVGAAAVARAVRKKTLREVLEWTEGRRRIEEFAHSHQGSDACLAVEGKVRALLRETGGSDAE